MRNSAGAISGTNTISKYGGPTEYLPRFSASIAKGKIVPRKTVPAAAAKKTLFASSIDSRETSLKSPPRPMREVRQTYSTSAPPMKSANSARMNMPRVGSTAKACTEVSTPDRTRKVPSRLSAKATIASSTVQLRKAPRFSVTASEWSSAVPTSHGMKEAFSTGSQNHHPPQPSS